MPEARARQDQKNKNTHIFQIFRINLTQPQAPAEDNEVVDRLAWRAI